METPATTAAGTAPAGKGPAHALVLDDDKKLAAQLEALLEDANFKVTVGAKAWDGLLLMGLLDAKPAQPPIVPDLLIVDALLPDRKGFEVLGRVRQAEHTQRVPIILMAGPEAKVPEFALFDANACLKKPFDADAFLGAVIKVLGLE